jgi:hypothetical protein
MQMTTVNNAPKLTSANTHELASGNIVHCHGSRFELTTRNSAADGCVWFLTKYLGAVTYADGSAAHEIMPKHWRDDWTVQGNELARWTVESA